MSVNRMKFLLVAGFSLFLLAFSNALFAQDSGPDAVDKGQEGEKINPSKIILEHVSDAHEFHFLTINHKPVSIPLPVILYSPQKGVSAFMSSEFHHGEEVHDGYLLMSEDFLKEHNLEGAKDAKGEPLYKEGKIYA